MLRHWFCICVTLPDLRCMSRLIWALTWQNQQNDCAQRRLRSAWASAQLIRVFAVRMKKAWVLSYPLSAQRRLWSDWADAQADPSLQWVHIHFVGFVMSQLICVLLCHKPPKVFSWRGSNKSSMTHKHSIKSQISKLIEINRRNLVPAFVQ